MADESHLDRLKNGVLAWNEWRKIENIEEVDLTHADLAKYDLSEANLQNANFAEANLDGAILRKSNLWGAHLSEVNLRGADLCEANLADTRFYDACLREANLSRTDLSLADFHEADLSGADLSDAVLFYVKFVRTNLDGTDFRYAMLQSAIFAFTDLSCAKGLDDCVCSGPSVVDFATLQASGVLPLNFLRGVGLSDGLIEYLPSLTKRAFEYFTCFISYARKDDAFVERLYADLQNKGIRCWKDNHDMAIGVKTRDAIDMQIRTTDKVVLVLSKNSISSGWVEDEITTAYAEEHKRKQIVLFPVRIDNAVLKTDKPWASMVRDGRNIGDFTKWKHANAYQETFQRVLRDLKRPAR